MASYLYVARTRTGEKVEGDLTAHDRRNAVSQLERMGYVPVSVKETGFGAAVPEKEAGKKKRARKNHRKSQEKADPRERKPPREPKKGKKTGVSAETSVGMSIPGLGGRGPKMNLRDVLLFTQELSDLLASGMTLGNALTTLSSRRGGKSQDAILSSLRDDIVQGASLSDALAGHPQSFSKLYVNMVRAGEASGTLPEVLERLAYHFARVQDAQEKVTMALVYPAIIMLVGAGTLIFSILFVIPRFTAIFNELDSKLPASTQFLANISEFLLGYWWLIIIAIVVGVVAFKRLVATPAGRRWWDGMQLRLPVVRGIVKANAFGHFARTLGALLANGVPVLNALTIVEETVGNTVITDEIRASRERVTDGSTISGPLSEGNVFPRLLTDMLAVGEETGDMSGALAHIANRYDRELDRTVKLFTTLLEPVMILLMASLVGLIAVSMLTAVFDMTSGLNP